MVLLRYQHVSKRTGLLLIVLSAGRLGNQLFMLAAALQISEIRKKRVILLLDDRQLVSVFKKAQNGNPLKIKFLASKKINRWLSRAIGKLDLLSEKKLALKYSIAQKFKTVENNEGFPATLLEEGTKLPWILSGFFQDNALVEGLGIRSQEFISLVLANDETKFDLEIKNKKLIGVHIRRGDYINIPQYGVLSIEYYNKAIETINVDQAKYLVASDDSKVFDLITFKESAEFVSPDFNSPLKTLKTLAACNYLIMSNSSFSFWAGWMVAKNGGKVYAPYPWFKEAIVPNNHLNLEKFIRIPSIFEENLRDESQKSTQ